MGVTCVSQMPVAEGKSVQQTVELLTRKLEMLGAEKQGTFCVDCETYHTAASTLGSQGQAGKLMYVMHNSEHPLSCFALFENGPCLIADTNFDVLMVKLKGFFQSAKASKIETRGTRYQYCDFLVKVGTVTMGPSARGISVEVEYGPCVVASDCWSLLLEFLQSFLGSHTPGAPAVFGNRHDAVYSPADTMVQYMELFNKIRKQQQVTCISCNYKSNTIEPFWDLSLEFPERYHCIEKGFVSLNQTECLLTEMLAKFTETEALEGRIYACDQCNSKRRKSNPKPLVLSEARKQLMIYRLPQVLRLHLKRFRWSGRNHREKIGVHVVFDQVLTMEPYCCRDMLSSLDKETFAYDLSAVVMHHGKGFGSGHYTAYCYNTEGGACALLCGAGDTEKGWFVHISFLSFYFTYTGIFHTLKSSGKNDERWIQILDISLSNNMRLF
uniref:Mediator of RNA polymerase II transcription subunit 20 n=1 Tax=Sus scrofa TaxID=9823 RepID=A0A8D1QST7_PIG